MHELARQTVTVHPKTPHQLLVDGAQFRVEDLWSNISPTPILQTYGNWAVANFVQRAIQDGFDLLPENVFYGKIDDLGYLVHISEIEV